MMAAYFPSFVKGATNPSAQKRVVVTGGGVERT
jgi:hypothetical protein